MHKRSLLQKCLSKSLSFMHARRREVLFQAANAVLSGANLSLTSIGKHLEGKAKTRHQIRKSDRLLGNKHLHAEIKPIYTALNRLLITHPQPVISVDWSCLSGNCERYLLRASISVKGRSHVCYQEVHPKSADNNTDAHNNFLDGLYQVLPDNICPIIATDAVFSVQWFKKVSSLGWDFVGRVRKNRGSIYDTTEEKWLRVTDVYQKTTQQPQLFGTVLLTKKTRLACQLVGYRKKNKGRHKKNAKGTLDKSSYSKVQSQSYKDPWLLATSLPPSKTLAKQVIKHYAKRMQIEEEFRDTKSERYGFGLNLSGSTIRSRVAVLLLINTLAAFLCWVLACMTISKGEHVNYHANSLKKVNVLSAITLGTRVFNKKTHYKIRDIHRGLAQFISLIATGEYQYA